MERRGRRFRLGLFALVASGLFLGLLGFIVQSSLRGDRATYFILFEENVKGMVIGSKVNFQGVPIGVVQDMRFQDGKTMVELRVDPSRANIQDLTRARMDRLLVTGQVTVELEGYGSTGKSLPPGAFIQPKEDPLHSLTASLPEVVDRAASVLTRLDALLANANLLLGDDNQAQFAAMLRHAAGAAQRFDEATLPATAELVADLRHTVTEFAALAPAVDDLLRETTALAGGVRGPVQTALASFRTALEDVRGLARQLKLAPDSLLFGVRPAAPAGGGR